MLQSNLFSLQCQYKNLQYVILDQTVSFIAENTRTNADVAIATDAADLMTDVPAKTVSMR